MTRRALRIDEEIRRVLDASGLSWTVEQGAKHLKILVDGAMVAVVPRSTKKSESRRYGGANALAQVRRVVRARGAQP